MKVFTIFLADRFWAQLGLGLSAIGPAPSLKEPGSNLGDGNGVQLRPKPIGQKKYGKLSFRKRHFHC